MMRLFIVFATNSDGESLDWFVRAPTVERAWELWRKIEMVADHDPSNATIFPVPDVSGPEGAVEWPAQLR
jgi:hypothetical protein